MSPRRTLTDAGPTVRSALYWARAELRRRWGPTLGVALVVALACSAPTAAWAGARRTASVVDRLRDEQRAADVQIQTEEITEEQIEEVRQLPGVEELGLRSTIFLRPSGTDLKPFLEFFAVGSIDGVSGYDVFRPRITAGRLPARDRADEVFVSQAVADRLDLEPGDRMSVDTLLLETVFAVFETGGIPEPDGPTIDLTVTGVGLLAPELLSPDQIPYGTLLLPPAFLEQHPEVAAFSDNMDVRLEGGDAAAEAFTEQVEGLVDEEIFVTPATQEVAQVRDGVGVQRTALLLFVVVAAAAGAVAVAQAASRTTVRHDDDMATLAALGLGPSARVVAVVALFAPAVLLGAAVGVVVAAIASPLASFGLAARLEPDPGFAFDPVALGLGAAVTVGLGVLAIAVAAAVTDRRRLRPSGRAPLPLVDRLATSLGPAPGIGIRWALVPGRGRTATPVRSALAGSVIGLGGVLAALSFDASLARLVDDPVRYGVHHDLEVGVVGDEAPDAEALAAAQDLATRDEVGALTFIRVSKLNFGGETHDAFGLEAIVGDIGYTVIEGEAPRGDDEVILGADVFDELDVAIGDGLTLPGGTRRLTVVGRGVFPPLDDANSLATGLGFTREGLVAVLDDLESTGASAGFAQTLVDAAPGVDVDDLRRAYVAEFGFARVATRPTSVANLAGVGEMPLFVGGFLGLLGLLAIAHAVVASARRRRRDLAVLRTLGFLRRDLARTVRAQAAAIVTLGVVVGIPSGLAVGRWAWRLVAGGIGVGTDPAAVGRVAGAAVVGALVVALLATTPAARAAGRARPATILRAE